MAKTVAIVIVLFLVTWLPFFTSGIVARICQRCYEDVFSNSATFFFLKFLQYTNSAGNPAVYAARMPRFRNAFKLVLAKITCSMKQSRFNEEISLTRYQEPTQTQTPPLGWIHLCCNIGVHTDIVMTSEIWSEYRTNTCRVWRLYTVILPPIPTLVVWCVLEIAI